MGPNSNGKFFITNLWPYSTFSSSTTATNSTTTSTSSRYRPQNYRHSNDDLTVNNNDLDNDDLFWNEEDNSIGPQEQEMLDMSGTRNAGRSSRVSQSDSTNDISETNQRSITPLFGLRSNKSVLHYNFTNLIDQHDTTSDSDDSEGHDGDDDDSDHHHHRYYLDSVDNEEIYSLSVGYNNPILPHESRPKFSSSQPPSTSRLTDLIRLFSIGGSGGGGSKSAPVTPEPPASPDIPDNDDNSPICGGNTGSDSQVNIVADPIQTRSWFSWWKSKAAASASNKSSPPKEIQMKTINGDGDQKSDYEEDELASKKTKSVSKKEEHFEIYVVQNSKETLNSIAARFHTTPAQIKHLNRLSMDCVFVGQVLQIPLIIQTSLSELPKSQQHNQASTIATTTPTTTENDPIADVEPHIVKMSDLACACFHKVRSSSPNLL